MGASVDSEKGKLCLKREGRRSKSRGTAARASLTVFSRVNGRGRQESCRIGCKNRNERPPKLTEIISPESVVKSSDSGLVKKTQIRHADALSRAVQAVAHDFGLPGNVVKTAQEADKFCQSFKPGPASSKSEYFKDEEGLIFRRRKNCEHQLVVPLSLTHKVIKMNHDPVTVDHPGRSRTLDILCLRFYWSGMRRHVEEYVKNCHACQRLNPGTSSKHLKEMSCNQLSRGES